MIRRLSQIIDTLSEFFAGRKGLLPMIGILLVCLNFVFQFFPELGWLKDTDLFMHIGIILAIVGFLLAWAL